MNAVANGSIPAAVQRTVKQVTFQPPAATSPGGAPDIWVILLDGYARAAFQRTPRVEDREFRSAMRREIRGRVVGKLPLASGPATS